MELFVVFEFGLPVVDEFKREYAQLRQTEFDLTQVDSRVCWLASRALRARVHLVQGNCQFKY